MALNADQVLANTNNDHLTTTTTTTTTTTGTGPLGDLDVLKDELYMSYHCNHEYEVLDMKFPMGPSVLAHKPDLISDAHASMYVEEVLGSRGGEEGFGSGSASGPPTS